MTEFPPDFLLRIQACKLAFDGRFIGKSEAQHLRNSQSKEIGCDQVKDESPGNQKRDIETVLIPNRFSDTGSFGCADSIRIDPETKDGNSILLG
jgi:hypothetical protein